VTERPLAAGKVMDAVPEPVVPSEFFAVKLKVYTPADATDAVKPPFASTRRLPPENVGAGDVATVSGRPAESLQPARTPGVLMARYVAMLAVVL